MNNIWKLISILVFLFIFVEILHAKEKEYVVKRVYDGDTFVLDIEHHPKSLREVKVRILGIDTPEMPPENFLVTGKLGKAKCFKEAEQALRARNALNDLLLSNGNKIHLKNLKYDKFGSRINADVYIDETNVAQYLIGLKLAIPYSGEAKTHDWCK